MTSTHGLIYICDDADVRPSFRMTMNLFDAGVGSSPGSAPMQFRRSEGVAELHLSYGPYRDVPTFRISSASLTAGCDEETDTNVALAYNC